MKIVINACYGGFGLSEKTRVRFRQFSGEEVPNDWDIPRDSEILVQIVEELGIEASDTLSQLEVVEIPDGVDWVIEEYDGIEWVSEVHRRWA